jgi:ABC-2 type transport system ATP-binding protein
MPAISASNLTKRYGRTAAVDNLSFNIEQGEIVGFLGPNGAGKTTTLRMLAGLIHPTSGSSRILEQRVPGSNLLEVGTMIEEPAFYLYMTGRDNLCHAARLHGGVTDKRVDEVLAFVNMDKAGHKKVSAYSQGMRQRLGLARALLWKPKVLLLDEPTNGLDPVGIAEFRESFRAVAQQGSTILISSHILAEIEKLVDRILAVEKGKLLFDGPLYDLTQRINEEKINYILEATNRDSLHRALQALGYIPSVVDDRRVRVPVISSEAHKLISKLSHQGVDLLEARREAENLEGAYLRLLQEESKPT